MVRLIAVLLLGTLATLVVVRALRRGEAQASFARSNVMLRKDNPIGFWFFTFVWGVVAAGSVLGAGVLLFYGISSSGPFASTSFLTFQQKEWPLGLMILACLYLLGQHVQARSTGRRPDGA